MRSVTKRHQTFKTRSESKWAECGFYFSLINKCYVCAYCNCRVQSLPDDVCMWAAHEQWSSSCLFLKIRKRRAMDVSNADQCVVCMNVQKNCVTLPCKHLCMCSDCTKTIFQCPLCRLKIDSILKIFP